MAIPIMILGESGSGKSASLRSVDPSTAILVQPISKPLPFRGAWPKWDRATKTGSVVSSDNFDVICKVIHSAAAVGKKMVIIDDFQYVMANEFMRRCNEKSFDKFTDIGNHAWQIINSAQAAAGDVRVYFLSHVENDSSGRSKVKTIGRMLDEKITLEGMFTIVLGAHVMDGRHVFTTKNSGMDTVKAPMGMFETAEIDNDLAMVDAAICDYYEINSKETK